MWTAKLRRRLEPVPAGASILLARPRGHESRLEDPGASGFWSFDTFRRAELGAGMFARLKRSFPRMKRSVVLGTALALVANGLVVAVLPTPAHAAADQDVGDILAGLDKFGTFTKDLASVGAFGQALPLVELAPAGDNALKFADAFGKSLHDPLAGKDHFTQLGGAYPLDLGDGRAGTLTVAATPGGVETLTTDVSVHRTVSSTLHVSTTSPRVDLSVPASVTLTLTAHLVWSYDTAGHAFSLQHAPGSPAIGVTADATLAASGDAAIGIMGVTIKDTSTFTLHAAINTFVDDPNGDGHLAFTEAGGGAGELSSASAAAGLFHPSLASPAGSASGRVDMVTKPLAGFSATGLAASVTVSWPDIGIGAPSVSPDSGLDPLARFQSLSPKDLSDGIKHLGDTVTALQRAKFTGGAGALGDVDLPFMKGSIADAVSVAESLASFVTANTEPATAGTGVAGLPKFGGGKRIPDVTHAARNHRRLDRARAFRLRRSGGHARRASDGHRYVAGDAGLGNRWDLVGASSLSLASHPRDDARRRAARGPPPPPLAALPFVGAPGDTLLFHDPSR